MPPLSGGDNILGAFCLSRNRHSRLWVVTTFFNPAGYRRRRKNFFIFRDNLTAPLLVVEIARTGFHELTRDAGEMVIQISGEDRIWQKERLLNLGISALPEHVDYVAWIDCDIVFESDRWIDAAQSMLDAGTKLVQPFECVKHLAKDVCGKNPFAPCFKQSDALFSQQSFARAYINGVFGPDWDVHPKIGPVQMANGVIPASLSETRPTPGFAWVGHREALSRYCLYDECVLGGGDSALAYASIGMPSEFANGRLSPAHTRSYYDWSSRFLEYSEQKLGFLSGTIYHLWHGSIRHRSYFGRHRVLAECDFDPVTDLRFSDTGAWEWARSDLPEKAAAYFCSRAEDGIVHEDALSTQ